MIETHPTDEALATAAQGGDREAIAQLYDRYSRPIYRYCYLHLTHPQEAEDATGDIMLRMVTHLTTFRQDASFKTWLYAIARRAVADVWRTKYRLPTAELIDVVGPETEPGDDAAAEAAINAERAAAARVFERLPRNYRTVLEHRFLQARTVDATAAAMNISTNNVKVLQHRALKRAAALANELSRP